MSRDGLRVEPDFKREVPDPSAQIDVFAVHEEAFVQSVELLEHRALDQNARPGHPVRRRRAGVVSRVADEFVGPTCSREQAMEKQRLGVRRAEPRKPSQREVERTFVVNDPRRYSRELGLGLCRTRQLSHILLGDRCIGVQEEHVWGLASSPTGVARMGEAAVLAQGDRGHRELSNRLQVSSSLEALSTTITLKSATRRESLDRSTDVFAAVVGDNDDVDGVAFHGATVPYAWFQSRFQAPDT